MCKFIELESVEANCNIFFIYKILQFNILSTQSSGYFIF